MYQYNHTMVFLSFLFPAIRFHFGQHTSSSRSKVGTERFQKSWALSMSVCKGRIETQQLAIDPSSSSGTMSASILMENKVTRPFSPRSSLQ